MCRDFGGIIYDEACGQKRALNARCPVRGASVALALPVRCCGLWWWVAIGGGSGCYRSAEAQEGRGRSAEGGSSDVCRPSAVEDVHGRVSALAESVREELLHGGVPASDIRISLAPADAWR